jgi:hypothetical protein
VPQVIRTEDYPLVSVTQECLSEQAIERLYGEQIDAAFARAPVAPQGLTVLLLLQEPMSVALLRSRELARDDGKGSGS